MYEEAMPMMVGSSHFALPLPDLAAWRAGNTGVEGVWSFDSGTPGRHVMIAALVHGNELCGAWAIKGLLEARLRPARGRLTLALCNLDAFDRFDIGNHDASRFVDEDMNRQWTSLRFSDPLTVERRRVAQLLPFVASADWLLDLHSMHESCAPLALTGSSTRNVELAIRMKAPQHIVIDAGHQDGVRMRDFGRFAPEPHGDPSARSILVECGFHGDPHSRDVAQDQCVRFLKLSGIVEPDTDLLTQWRLPDAQEPWILQVTGAVVAQSPRFHFVAPYTGLEVIPRQGTVIGYDDKMEVKTPHDNCVLVMPSTRQARPGVTVVRFASRCDAAQFKTGEA
jgi:predicted deacylase